MAELPHFGPSGTVATAATGPWHRDMNRYHWFVLVVASLVALARAPWAAALAAAEQAPRPCAGCPYAGRPCPGALSSEAARAG